MLKAPHTDKFYTYPSKYIENVLALRQPERKCRDICQIMRRTCLYQKHLTLMPSWNQ